MFCTNCGNQMSDSSTFCTNCGTKIQAPQPIGGQDISNPNFINPNTAASNFVNPNNNAPRMSNIPKGTGKRKTKTPIIVTIAVAGVLAFCLILFGAFKLLGIGSNSSPTNAVKSLFKAISNEDAGAIIDLMYFDAKYKDMVEIVEDQLDESLSGLNEQMEDKIGKNWTSKIEYGHVNEKDDDLYTVEIEMNGEKAEITVIKEAGKYYIDPLALSEL